MISIADSLDQITPMAAAIGIGGLILFIILSSIQSSPSQGKRIPTAWFYDHGFSGIFSNMVPDFYTIQEKFGPAYRIRFFGESIIWVGGYPNARQVLNGENDLVQAHWPIGMVKLIGPNALVNMTGHEHDKLRRSLLVAFTPVALRGYLPKLQRLAELAVSRWSSQDTISAYDEVRWFAARVGTDLLVGFDETWTSPEGFAEINEIYKTWWQGIFNIPLDAPGTAFRRSLNIKKELDRRILDGINKLREKNEAARDEGKEVENNTAMMRLINAQHEDGRPFTDRELVDAGVSLLVGSLDTTSTQLLCILRRLSTSPAVVEKLRTEQRQIVQQHGTTITDDALKAMVYTEALIKESLRVETASTSLFRRAKKDFVLASGHQVKKGEKLTVSLTHVLKSDESFKDDEPLAYKPERWISEDGSGKVSKGYIPWGGGSRLCLGYQLAMNEMKTLLATIARGYEFEYLDVGEQWQSWPFAFPMKGMPMRFRALK